MADPFGVYIHIPFCRHRCGYCAFATWSDRHHLEEDYLRAVRTDIERSVAAGMHDVSSVFVGGGTPSLVDAKGLGDLLAAIPRTPFAEVTVECNPDDVTVELLTSYLAAGVTRVSLGVQSMSAHVLRSLDRQHDPGAVDTAIAAIKNAGVPTFNLDLIYGTNGESLDDWRRTLERVIEFDPPHLSAYALTVEAGTPLAEQPHLHPSDDDTADKYELADEMLVAVGLENYEVSNWARPGHECQHNLLYWRQGNYRGFGCAAHSHENGHRWWNVRTPDRYIEHVRCNDPVMAAGEDLDEKTRRFERYELQLRLREGVPADVLDGDALPGLVSRVGDRWVLTRRGRLMANEIATRLNV